MIWNGASQIMPGSITFENILSIRVLEWLVFCLVVKLKVQMSLRQESLKTHLSDYAHYNLID